MSFLFLRFVISFVSFCVSLFTSVFLFVILGLVSQNIHAYMCERRHMLVDNLVWSISASFKDLSYVNLKQLYIIVGIVECRYSRGQAIFWSLNINVVFLYTMSTIMLKI